MLATRYRRPYAGLAAAIILAAAVTGCGWFKDPDSDSTPTATPTTTVPPPSEPPPSDPLASLHLQQFWVLENLGCVAPEVAVPQNQTVAALVTVCRQRPSILRLLNKVETSVRVTFEPGSLRVTYRGPHAKDGPVTAAMLHLLHADYQETATSFVLPAGDSAVVTLVGSVLPTVAAEPTLGGKAFFARAVGNLVEQLPWDKLGQFDSIAGKAAACAGGAFALAEKQELSVKEAMDNAKECYELSEEISKKWESRASRAPEPKLLRTRLSTVAHEGASAASRIRTMVTGIFRVIT